MNLAILLATYNSSRYLEQQLDSLFTQTYNDFTLYVRDDGSSDTTLNIISEYKKTHEIILLDDPIIGRGAMGSFMWMLESVNADYYMFCDHDDVWLPDKIERSVTEILEYKNQEIPIALCSDLYVVDKDLNVVNKSMWSLMKQRPKLLTQKKYAVSTNLFTGCTMIINEAAKRVSLPISSLALMHDHWIGLRVIAKGGTIGYINDSLILYRQHGSNVCGVYNVGGANYIQSKIRQLRQLSQSWIKSYQMSKMAFDGKLSFCYYLFWKFCYLILR